MGSIIERLRRSQKFGSLIDRTKSSDSIFALLRAAMLSGAIGLLASAVERHMFFKYISWAFLTAAAVLSLGSVACGIRYFYPKIKKYFIAKPASEEELFDIREKRIQKDCAGKKAVHVVIMCDGPGYWSPFESLYSILKNDPRFKVTVLAIPEEKYPETAKYDMPAFFEKNNIPYIRGYNEGKFFDIAKIEPHYIFPSRPYDDYRPEDYTHKKLKSLARVCHIEYATCLARGQILNLLYSFVYLKEYDIIFSETPKHTKMYLLKQEEQPITNTKIVLAGSPKFDAIYYNDFQPPASEYRHTVLYTPRWNLTDGTSSFLALKDTFFKMAKEHPDVEFIFRPHPLMEKTYLENDASAIAWKEFIGQFKIYKNAVIDEKPDYIETFKKATVLLSDFSSFLAEFLLTGKPVVYFHKKYILNSFGEYIAQGFYWCYDEKETSDTIRDLIQGNDPKKETRKEVIQNGFYFGGQTAAREIRDCLLRDYNGEEIAYHEKP